MVLGYHRYVCMHVCMYLIIYKLFLFLCINPQKIKKPWNYGNGENIIKLPSWRHLCICFVGTLLYRYIYIYMYIYVYIYIYNPIYITYTYVNIPSGRLVRRRLTCIGVGGVGWGVGVWVGWGGGRGVITSCRARFVGCKHDVIALCSGWKCYVIALFSGWKCYVIALFSGWKCYVIALFSGCKCYVIVLFSGWKCYVLALCSGWKCYFIVLFSGWKCYVMLFSGWKCYVIALFSGWECYVIVLFSGWKCYVIERKAKLPIYRSWQQRRFTARQGWKQCWRRSKSIGRPVQQEQCEQHLPNVTMRPNYLGCPRKMPFQPTANQAAWS